jgi:hypothetical protein
MLKLVKKIVVWAFLVFAALLAGNIIYTGICRFPADRDWQLGAAQDLSLTCTQLTPGTDWQVALQRLNQGPEPPIQRLEVDRLVVQRRGTQCIVILDPASRRVVKAELQNVGYWDERNI